jgi:acetoin utilization protein AcuC
VASCAFIHSEEIERYHYPPSCPFKTERAGQTAAILKQIGMYAGDGKREVAPEAATEEELLKFHAPEYIRALQKVSAGQFESKDLFMGLGTEDTPVFADLFAYASLAAGATITGARLILENKADIVFNPSGGFHHALPDKAGGFCYINDIALGCKVLAEAGKRVFCLDLDAHHGNGTQEAFYRDRDVFTVSFHESGKTLYPWGGGVEEIGEGAARGFNVNVPLPAGADDDAYMAAFNVIVSPLIRAYGPDVIVLEIGMDILAGDPLTHLAASNNTVADIIPKLLRFEKPVLATGGGGYNPGATARGWALAWIALTGGISETDMYIGLGGTFLGNTEWNAGLRDMHSYASGEDRVRISKEVTATVEWIRKHVFPTHGIQG